jgi:hypothetical protein|tara:strand:- start:2102 stop:3163 length:1062 start_codon:yes stop_codon:yes gene_type:complete
MAKSSGTLGEAYAGLGTARRDAVKSRRFHNTIENALDTGADLAFTASDHLEEKAQYEGEFESTQNMLGGDAKVVNLKTGGKWEDKTLFGRGDKESYLNPFSGDRGLRVGDTLYDDVDITAISRGDEYLGIDKNDEGKLKSYRDNMASVYGKNISETEWGKSELDERMKEKLKPGLTLSKEHSKFRKDSADAEEQKDIYENPHVQSQRELDQKIYQKDYQSREDSHLQHQKDLQAQAEASKGTLTHSQKIEKAGEEAYDKARSDEVTRRQKAKEDFDITPEGKRQQEIERIRKEEVVPFEIKKAGDEAEARVRKDWAPLLERQKNLQKMKHGEERIAEKASIWEEFLSKSMNNE